VGHGDRFLAASHDIKASRIGSHSSSTAPCESLHAPGTTSSDEAAEDQASSINISIKGVLGKDVSRFESLSVSSNSNSDVGRLDVSEGSVVRVNVDNHK